MSEHTNEPWDFSANDECDLSFDIIKDGGWFIASTHDGVEGQNNAEANARRIVACVNACAGIPTDVLEHESGSALITECKIARKQRDELLAALKKAQEDINWMCNSEKLLNRFVFNYVDEAIAKAK